MRKSAGKVLELLKATLKHWRADNAPQLGAALGYYAVLALPPILVILLFGLSLFYDSKQASTQIAQQLSDLMGQQSGQFMQQMMSNPQMHGKGPGATGIAIVVLIFSAAVFFVQLQSALNSAWGVEQRPDIGWVRMALNQVLPFLLLIVIGVLLVISVFVTALLAAAQETIGSTIPGGAVVWHGVEFLVSCGILTSLFAMIFKWLPNARMHWRDAWVGGLVTAFLFTTGKVLLGLYLGHSSVASAYGVAGSIVLILVWVYYSTQIFLFGAEFTQIYASQHGRRIVPSKHAQWKAEGEGAAEDQEEAKTGGKPDATGNSQPQAAAVTHRPSTAKGGGQQLPTPAASPAGKNEVLGDIANRVHSWRPIHRDEH